MRIAKMQKGNPLAEWRNNNLSIDWKEVSKKTGITIQQLLNLSKMDAKKTMQVRLWTYVSLKVNLGVDLLDFKYDK